MVTPKTSEGRPYLSRVIYLSCLSCTRYHWYCLEKNVEFLTYTERTDGTWQQYIKHFDSSAPQTTYKSYNITHVKFINECSCPDCVDFNRTRICGQVTSEEFFCCIKIVVPED